MKRYWRVTLHGDGDELVVLVPVLTPKQAMRAAWKRRPEVVESKTERGALILFIVGIGTYIADTWKGR